MPSCLNRSDAQGPRAMSDWVPASGRPGTEGGGALACFERPLVCLYPPIAAGTVQRPRITGQEDAAEPGKTRRISPCDAKWVADARSLRPEHPVREDRIERRFERQGRGS